MYGFGALVECTLYLTNPCEEAHSVESVTIKSAQDAMKAAILQEAKNLGAEESRNRASETTEGRSEGQDRAVRFALDGLKAITEGASLEIKTPQSWITIHGNLEA